MTDSRILYCVLKEEGLFSEEPDKCSVDCNVNCNKDFFDHLLSEGKISIIYIRRILHKYYGIEHCDLNEREPSGDCIAILDYELAVKYTALPVGFINDRLVLAMTNPFDITAADDISALTGKRVLPVLSDAGDISFFINKYYDSVKIDPIASQYIVDENLRKNDFVLDPKLRAGIQNAPAVRLLDSMLLSAVLYNASDIHIEPFERNARSRYRIDGHLKEFQNIPLSLHPNIIGRLKVMGGMDISDSRLPQDGHFSYAYRNDRIEFRVSTMPVVYGEKAVIRLIHNKGRTIDKEDLGFFPEDIEDITRMFHSVYGAVLVTGPTGSGKTTTLAGFINELNCEEINIVTVEDPVENHIYGVNQININTKIGLDFDDILRSILRQDPDVVMVGEIRDSKTAYTAVKAAIAGQLVLATLHTNDAPSAVIRLVNMDIEHYLISAALRGVIAQRLVRRVCPYCIESARLERYARLLRLSPDTRIYRGAGCPRCNNTGYKGRFAVYEYFFVDDEVRAALDGKATYEALKNLLRKKGMKSIWDNALRNVMLGNTTPEEMLQAVFNT